MTRGWRTKIWQETDAQRHTRPMGEQRLEDYLAFNVSFLDSHVLPIHGTITLVNAGVTADRINFIYVRGSSARPIRGVNS